MESINPIDNPTLSIKRNFNKRFLIQLDKSLWDELHSLVEDNKDVYNSVSHYIRCAIIQKLHPSKALKDAYNRGFSDCKNQLLEELEK